MALGEQVISAPATEETTLPTWINTATKMRRQRRSESRWMWDNGWSMLLFKRQVRQSPRSTTGEEGSFLECHSRSLSDRTRLGNTKMVAWSMVSDVLETDYSN
jgi:hypothetical protein